MPSDRNINKNSQKPFGNNPNRGSEPKRPDDWKRSANPRPGRPEEEEIKREPSRRGDRNC